MDFAQNCASVKGGTGCPVSGDGTKPPQPSPNQSNLLFSWGTKEDPVARPPDGVNTENSWLRVKFGADVDFRFSTVAFATIDLIPNLGPVAGPNLPFSLADTQGAGTMAAYERTSPVINFLTSNHDVTQQRMDIFANYRDEVGSSKSKTVAGWTVAANQEASPSGDTKYLINSPQGPTISQFTLDADREFFFRNSGVATVNDPTDGNAEQDTTVRLRDGDELLFQFYESVWNNQGLPDVSGPDAYYGSFNVVITPLEEPESTLAVTANQTQADLRAGDTATSAGSLTASNEGETGSQLSGSFAALTGATGQIVADDDPNPPDTALAFGPLVQGAGAERDYTFSAATVAFDASDAGSTGEVFTVTQAVTSDADTNPNQTRTVTGTVKGPILGLSELSAPDVADSADWIPYDAATGEGGTINLGAIEVGDDFLLKELTLANLFGADEGLLSLLTFYNVGLNDPTNRIFDFKSGRPSQGDQLQVGDPDIPLVIRFDPDDTDIGSWTAELIFVTDQNRAQGVCSLGAPCSQAYTMTFLLQATLRDAGVPLPSVVSLLGAGLLPLIAWGRRRRASA